MLERQYDGAAYRAASMASRGYLPYIQRQVAESPRRIEFRAVGRDSLTKIPTGEWHWSYLVEPSGAGASRVTIAYRWAFLMDVLGLGMMRSQANAAITRTAVALDVRAREYARRAGR